MAPLPLGKEVTALNPLKPETGWVRYLGILTAIGLAVLVFADYILPSRLATIVGALALIFVIVAGGQFLFHGATLVSTALEGRRRTQFQVAVSLAAPITFTQFLASRADAIPIETLWRMLTPWLLIPLEIIAWVCWFAGGQVNREHPFRGFLIAAAVLGVLCLFWSAGMATDSDYDGEGSSLYLDPEKAERARETGEYVWRFVLYVTTAYLALFLKLRRLPRDHERLRRQLEAAQSLTTAYNKVLQTPRNHFWPLSALPADKETMKAALKLDAAYQASQGVINKPIGDGRATLRDGLIISYASLADFVPDDLAARVNRHWKFIMTEGERVTSGERIDAMALAEALRRLAPSEEDERASQSAREEWARLADEMRAYLDRMAPRKEP